MPVGLNTSKVIKTLGDYFIATLVYKIERILTDFEGKRSAGKYEFVFFLLDFQTRLFRKIKLEVRTMMSYPQMMLGLHSDNFGRGRRDNNRKIDTFQDIATMTNGIGGSTNAQNIVFNFKKVNFFG